MNELQDLAARVRQGEADAAAELKRKLGVQMTRIVRRALRTRNRTLSLTRQIVAEAASAAPADWPGVQESRSEAVGRAARRLCEVLVGRLRTSPAGYSPTLDTVHGW